MNMKITTEAEAEMAMEMVRQGYATMVCKEHHKPVKYKDRPALGCAKCCKDRVKNNREAFARNQPERIDLPILKK